MKVRLFHPLNAPKGQLFEAQHAENLMALEKNGGWYRESESESNVNESGTDKRKVKKSDKS